MRTPMTIRLDRQVLKRARSRATSENRTLTNYIETLVRRDLRMLPEDARIEVIAPADIRMYKPVAIKGESKKRRAFRKRLFTSILDAGGVDG